MEARVTSCEESSNNKDEFCTDDCGLIVLSSTAVILKYGDGTIRAAGTYTVIKDMIYFSFVGSSVNSYQYTLAGNFLTLVSQGPFGCVLTATYSKQ